MPDSHLAFDDSGHRIEAVDFDFSALDGGRDELRDDLRAGRLSQAEMDAAIELFQTLLKWMWQSGMKNPDGVKIRAIICCWIFLKPLRPLNLTQLAEHYGMDKQSFGRWVDEFKLRFPHIRTVHMRNLE